MVVCGNWDSAGNTSPKMLWTFLWEDGAAEGVSKWFLIYRIIHAGAWTFLLAFSFWWDESPEGHGYWIVYFTHWDIILGVLQSYAGLFLAAKPPSSTTFSWLGKLFWVSNGASCIVTAGMVVIYWTLDFPIDKQEHVTPTTILNHCGNFVLMTFDLLFTAFPVTWASYILALALPTIYCVILSPALYFSGFKTKSGRREVYSVIDWHTPWKPIAVTIIIWILVSALYFGMLRINRWKMGIHAKRTDRLELTISK